MGSEGLTNQEKIQKNNECGPLTKALQADVGKSMNMYQKAAVFNSFQVCSSTHLVNNMGEENLIHCPTH